MAESICVIFNPAAGRKRAERRLRRVRERLGGGVRLLPTQKPGHAEELALEAAREGFDVVAAAGGDGTVHEVANGLLRDEDLRSDFGVIPIGSANDYAYSLRRGSSPDARGIRRVDVGVVADDRGRRRFFVCGLGLGLNARVTLESRSIRYLQGVPLYGLAALRAIRRRGPAPMLEFQCDEEPPQSAATLACSVLLGRREGNFLMAPDAQLDDGQFQLLRTDELSTWQLLRFLPRLALAGPPRNRPEIHVRQATRVRILSRDEALPVHLDGEILARPVDGVRRLDIHLCPRALAVRLWEV